MSSIRLEIPRYIKYVELSKSRREKFYSKADKIPRRMALFKFSAEGFLLDAGGNKVVKNKRSAGTPKMRKINGQNLYSGNMTPHERSKTVEQIKASFAAHVRTIAKLHLPIRIKIELHECVGDGNWDLDNLWLYNKCFQDVLVGEGKIPDDSVLYVTAAGAPEFYPVETDEERKLVFVLEKEDRDCILTNSRYAYLHSPDGEGQTNTTGTSGAAPARRKRTDSTTTSAGEAKPKGGKLLPGRRRPAGKRPVV